MFPTIRRLCLTGALLLAAGSARADVLSFTYTFATGDVLAASLFGTLEADGNTFDVAGHRSVTFNGADVTFAPDYFQAYSDYYAGNTPYVSDTGRLTLDGSFANLIDFGYDSGGFDIIVGDGLPYSPNIGVFGFSDLNDQTFSAASFTATFTAGVVATPVPEPATLALLSPGLLGLWAARRRIPARR